MPKVHCDPEPSMEATFSRLADIVPAIPLKQLRDLARQDGYPLWQLRFSSGTSLFTDDELSTVERLAREKSPMTAQLRDHMVVILKATRLCNLRCTYCHSWRDGPGNTMPFDVLARITRDVLADKSVRAVDFVWHGGEVTLLPTRYIKRALWLQQRFGSPRTEIVNSIQTNATLLTCEWIELFLAYKFSVGVSIDGPPEVHDLRRVTVKGRGTSKDVERGLSMLRDAGIKFGALAVIDECVLALGPKAYLDYLVSVGAPAVALLNALPANGGGENGAWFAWSRFTQFLRDLFEVWWKDYKDVIVVRELQSLVEALATGYTGLCIYRENCMGRYLTIEPNGDVSACDKYVGDPDFVFGNITATGLSDMLAGSKKLTDARAGVELAKTRASTCPEYAFCSGGCPHDVRLRQMHGSEASIDCCGLSSLISDIRKTLSTQTREIGGFNAA